MRAGHMTDYKLLAHRAHETLQCRGRGRGLAQLDATDLGLARPCTASKGLLVELVSAAHSGEQASGIVHAYIISDVPSERRPPSEPRRYRYDCALAITLAT